MTRGIFGWDLPPGVSMRDIDPPDELAKALELLQAVADTTEAVDSFGRAAPFKDWKVLRDKQKSAFEAFAPYAREVLEFCQNSMGES